MNLIRHQRPDIDKIYLYVKDVLELKYQFVTQQTKRRVLVVFDDMIADMESNKKLSPIFIELFSRGRKLNISLVFISQSYSYHNSYHQNYFKHIAIDLSKYPSTN